MRTALLFVVGSVALVACLRDNPNYICEGPGCPDARLFDAGRCTSASNCNGSSTGEIYCSDEGVCSATCDDNTDCAIKHGGTLEVCNTEPAGTGECVACLASSDCGGTTPVCNDESKTCEACEENSDCIDTGICIADGSCALSEALVFVSATGSGTTCTESTPCTIETAFSQVATGSVVVVLNSAPLDLPAIPVVADGFTIHGRGTATLTTTQDSAPVVGIAAGALTLDQITLSGITSTNSLQEGATCTGSGQLRIHRSTVTLNRGWGVSAANSCAIAVSRTRVIGNFTGGITSSGNSSAILSNVVVQDNNSSNSVGVQLYGTGLSTVEHLTVFNNASSQTYPGIRCETNPSFSIRNSIVFNNGSGAQIDPDCSVDRTLIGPSGLGIEPEWVDVINADPEFDTTSSYQLKATSPARDRGAALGAIDDIDGDRRDSMPDVGADEYVEQ